MFVSCFYLYFQKYTVSTSVWTFAVVCISRNTQYQFQFRGLLLAVFLDLYSWYRLQFGGLLLFVFPETHSVGNFSWEVSEPISCSEMRTGMACPWRLPPPAPRHPSSHSSSSAVSGLPWHFCITFWTARPLANFLPHLHFLKKPLKKNCEMSGTVKRL